jgi:hypothetical protein
MVIHWAPVMIGLLRGPVEEFGQGPVAFKNGPKDLLASRVGLDSVHVLGDANRGIVSWPVRRGKQIWEGPPRLPPERRVFSFNDSV